VIGGWKFSACPNFFCGSLLEQEFFSSETLHTNFFEKNVAFFLSEILIHYRFCAVFSMHEVFSLPSSLHEFFFVAFCLAFFFSTPPITFLMA